MQVVEEAKKLTPHPCCKTVAIYGGQRIRGLGSFAEAQQLDLAGVR